MTIDTSRHNFSSDVAAKQLDRRTLIKAGAWSAPVLALTTAAPAYAASVDDIVISQAYFQDSNNGSFSVYLAVKTTAPTPFSATVTITPTGTIDTPFTGEYKITGQLGNNGGLDPKAAGAPLVYSDSMTLGTQDKQGKIEVIFVKVNFKNTSQSVTIKVSATGHVAKTRTLTGTLSS